MIYSTAEKDKNHSASSTIVHRPAARFHDPTSLHYPLSGATKTGGWTRCRRIRDRV
ncbi:hypothetical protein POX_h09611 [Penicillium oxalicum]|uniref:hypothetical protein n=1 Tax=Penicillium oxalicum TaxID=69781 RepID=UPI0020B7B256|nr:hypothetical protein POX_h09611 [Penicillium oxalicum]KAI2785849.1 hypothetical protein POX_h09611 [Penicillium oxalicum]